MNQLEQALKRIITVLVDKQRARSPCLFSKLDTKERSWYMIVSDENTWNFCYALTSHDPEASADDLCIVVPNSLQTGWCESTPFFCAPTDTTQEVIKSLLYTKFLSISLKHT